MEIPALLVTNTTKERKETRQDEAVETMDGTQNASSEGVLTTVVLRSTQNVEKVVKEVQAEVDVWLKNNEDILSKMEGVELGEIVGTEQATLPEILARMPAQLKSDASCATLKAMLVSRTAVQDPHARAFVSVDSDCDVCLRSVTSWVWEKVLASIIPHDSPERNRIIDACLEVHNEKRCMSRADVVSYLGDQAADISWSPNKEVGAFNNKWYTHLYIALPLRMIFLSDRQLRWLNFNKRKQITRHFCGAMNMDNGGPIFDWAGGGDPRCSFKLVSEMLQVG